MINGIPNSVKPSILWDVVEALLDIVFRPIVNAQANGMLCLWTQPRVHNLMVESCDITGG